MKVYRVTLKGWVASFRYPIFVTGFQPTLPVPPYSTIYGIVSAACGRKVTPEDIPVWYVFKSEAKGTDLETIYELSAKTTLRAKSNVVKREFLINPELHIYIQNKKLAENFRNPHYPLLIGRSTELAFAEEIKEVELKLNEGEFILGGTLLPFPPLWPLNGIVQALPTHFSDTFPRKPLGTRPFFLVKNFQKLKGRGWVDEEKGWGVKVEINHNNEIN